MLELLLIRHGETAWNSETVFRGQLEVPLSETGKRQAVLLADYLKNEPIDIVYTSPMQRALGTAVPLARAHNLEPVAVSNLTDMDFGEWQGKTLSDVMEEYPELYRDWVDTPEQILLPGGESLGQVSARTAPFLEDAMLRCGEGRIAIVTHRVIVKLLICHILELSNSYFWHFQVNTGSITRFQVNGVRAVMMGSNDISYLNEKSGKGIDF